MLILFGQWIYFNSFSCKFKLFILVHIFVCLKLYFMELDDSWEKNFCWNILRADKSRDLSQKIEKLCRSKSSQSKNGSDFSFCLPYSQMRRIFAPPSLWNIEEQFSSTSLKITRIPLPYFWWWLHRRNPNA